MFSYFVLPSSFRYASFYHKSGHKNLLEFITCSIEPLMISVFCCNENLDFHIKSVGSIGYLNNS